LKSDECSRILNNVAHGAAQKALTIVKIKDVEIPLPSLSTQHRIATILSRYYSLIENYQKQIKLLEEAAQRLYKEWFVDLHFPGHENIKIVNGVPEGWEKKKAIDFFEMSIGRTPPRAEKEWFSTSYKDVPWVSISDMKNIMFVNETGEKLTQEACNKFNVKIVPEGTVLLSFKLTVGRVSIADIPVCTNEAIAHFMRSGNSWREYTFLYLKNYHYDSLGNTSGISKAVNSTIIKNMPFLMPCDEILKSFSEVVSPIFAKIKITYSQIRLLTEARDRLLPKLMSGEFELK
jgi:type I restriction enzyme S subunit